MTIRRLLLARRRYDSWLLASAFFGLAVLLPIGKIAMAVLAASGLYLAVIRHRAMRWAPPAFSIAVLAYAVWSIGLSLLRGEGFDGNRLLSYAAIEAAVVALPLGLCLVARPLDAMISGARVGIAALLVAAPIEYLLTGERVGLGSNEAILAFAAMAVGLVARVDAARALALLPNGRFWPYLAIVPVILTQTRAALVVVPLLVVIDLVGVFARKGRLRLRPATIGVAAIVLAVIAVPLAAILAERVAAGMSEIAHYRSTGDGFGSINIRLVMWSGALEVLRENPLIGVGSTNRMEAVGALAGANAYLVTYYTHLHNFILDEALSSGLVGLALLMAVFAVFLGSILRSPFATTRLKETSVLVLALVFSFGMFHGVLINEWMIVIVFGFMSVSLTALRRRQLAVRRRLAA